MAHEQKLRILIADDHEMVRLGLKALLADSEINVAAEANTGQAAVALTLESPFHVVLLDVVMPDGDGLSALARIKIGTPDLPVLLFSAFENPANVARAVALGASGFLLKGCRRDELIGAIRTAATGESLWDRETLRAAGRSLRSPRGAGNLEVTLTEAEGEVLRHIGNGLTNKQIAVEMQITYEKAKEHVMRLMRMTGLADRTQAAVWAMRNNLIP
jgi:DNA-binding NarL/FixJ family response regulator